MMKMVYQEGRYAPRLFCGVCDTPIDTAEAGVAHPRPVLGLTELQQLPLVFAHKGDCLNQAIRQFDEGGWSELGTFLMRFCWNTGVPPEQMKYEQDTEDEVGTL
jgi:hypothetical protein